MAAILIDTFQPNLDAILSFKENNKSSRIKLVEGRLYSFLTPSLKCETEIRKKTIQSIDATCHQMIEKVSRQLQKAQMEKKGVRQAIRSYKTLRTMSQKIHAIYEFYFDMSKKRDTLAELNLVAQTLDAYLTKLQGQYIHIFHPSAEITEQGLEALSPPHKRKMLSGHKIERVEAAPEEETKSLEVSAFVQTPPTPPEELTLDTVVLHRIYPRDLKPGDLICTYESTSTSPTKILAILAQTFTRSGSKKNLHKMLHFEIILEVGARGVMTVAHADGISKKLHSEIQDPTKYPPGTAIVVMRAKNPALRDEILKVASTTVDKGNEWKIKGLTDQSTLPGQVVGMMGERAKAWMKTTQRKREKMARLAVDSYDKFYCKDRTKLKAMNCAQFASNVINSSLIRLNPKFKEILLDEHKSRDIKTKEIAVLLGEEDFKNSVAACGLFHEEVTSALLSEHILSGPENWEVPGYIGIVQEAGEGKGPQPSEKESGRPILDTEIKQLGFEPTLTSSVFHPLGLLQLSGTREARDIKLTIAFIYLYAKTNGLNPTDVVNAIFYKKTLVAKTDEKILLAKAEDSLNNFLQLIESFQKQPITEEALSEQGKVLYTPLPLSELSAIGLQVIKTLGCRYSEMEKEAIRSTLAIEKMHSIIKRISNVSPVVALGALTILAVSGLPISIPAVVTIGLSMAALSVCDKLSNSIFPRWISTIRQTYRAAQPTHLLKLKSDVGFGRRPYLVYSGDGGKTFLVEKAKLKEGSTDEWYLPFRVTHDLEYRFFVGPEDLDIKDPYKNARWQKTEDGKNVHVSLEDLSSGVLDENQLRSLPVCNNPHWL